MLHIASIHSTRLTEIHLGLINMMRRRDSVLNRTKITPCISCLPSCLPRHSESDVYRREILSILWGKYWPINFWLNKLKRLIQSLSNQYRFVNILLWTFLDHWRIHRPCFRVQIKGRVTFYEPIHAHALSVERFLQLGSAHSILMIIIRLKMRNYYFQCHNFDLVRHNSDFIS